MQFWRVRTTSIMEAAAMTSSMRLLSTRSLLTTVDFECFGVALLAHYLPKAFFPNQGPLASVIHISAHGNNEGFALTSGQRIFWGQLAGLLRPINRAFAGRLILAMSTCEGLHAAAMALSDGDLP